MGIVTKNNQTMIEIDTKIRHVTKAGSNLFLDLGIEPKEAERCHLSTRQKNLILISVFTYKYYFTFCIVFMVFLYKIYYLLLHLKTLSMIEKSFLSTIMKQ